MGQAFLTARVGREGASIWESGEEENRGVSEVEQCMATAVQGHVSIHSVGWFSTRPQFSALFLAGRSLCLQCCYRL